MNESPGASNAPSLSHNGRNEQTAYIIGVIAVCFAALGLVIVFLGDVCCGFIGWLFALVAMVLSIVSLLFNRNKIALIALIIGILSILYSVAIYMRFNDANWRAIHSWNEKMLHGK